VERAYRSSTRALGALTCLLGVAIVVVAIANGGGPLALGVVVGVLFALLGAGRFYLAGRSGRRSGRA
jgi:multisubunit Na+/H+ antiporter MnhG subunit